VKTGKRHFPRFDRTERVVHWTNATIVLVLIATGALLKFPGFEGLVGRRLLLKNIHVYVGFFILVPIIVGIALPAGRQLRRDLGRLNRWDDEDRKWWRRDTKSKAKLGKFNPGQKLNAAFVGASLVVMLATGLIMKFPDRFPNSIRTGSEFVHDATFLVLTIVIIGHIMFAFRDPDSLRAMLKGWVPEAWAKRERSRWWAELDSAYSASADAPGDVAARGEERGDEAGVGAREVPVAHVVDGGAADGVGHREL
jgi:formate dehydrogenase subunit gamma